MAERRFGKPLSVSHSSATDESSPLKWMNLRLWNGGVDLASLNLGTVAPSYVVIIPFCLWYSMQGRLDVSCAIHFSQSPTDTASCADEAPSSH
eukprot:1484197-Pleurochrysis_carterae.AAC.1